MALRVLSMPAQMGFLRYDALGLLPQGLETTDVGTMEDGTYFVER